MTRPIERLITDELKKPKLNTKRHDNSEFISALEKSGMSHTECAAYLDVGWRIISYWRSGERKCRHAYVELLKMASKNKET